MEDRDLAEQDLLAAWDRWWAGIAGTPGQIVWDADPGDLEADLDRFAGPFGKALPVVDAGCGDGRQTRFLARHFPDVLGVNVSAAAAAVARARTADNPPNAGFGVLDARDPAGAARLHRELGGDANVYIRGVLQALPPAGRPQAVQAIAALLGATGTLFAKELPPDAASYFEAVTRRHGLLPGLAKVLRHIPPGQITLPELVRLFPADLFAALRTGTSRIHTVNTLPDGEVIMVPAVWALIRPRNDPMMFPMTIRSSYPGGSMTVPETTAEPQGWRVLGFGRDPHVSAAIQEGLRAQGIRARAFALTDDPDGDARLARELDEATWDGVAVGGFINGQNPDVRPTLQTTMWFNRVLNIIHAHAPDAKIILVRDPADALPAIERVLGLSPATT